MAFIGVLGFLGVIICIILLVIALVRKRPKKKIVIALVVCFLLFSWALSSPSPAEDEKHIDTKDTQTPEVRISGDDENEGRESEQSDIEQIDTTDYLFLSPEVLFEYGDYLAGERVVTAFSIADISTGVLKAKSENNDSIFFSINCKFDDENITKQFEEGNLVTIAGTVKEKDTIGSLASTTTLESCSVIGHGEILQELKDKAEDQTEVCAQRKADYEAQIAVAEENTREEYIAQCKTVDYNDVARNPDSYDGSKVKISGEVIQVSEGFFDSVTLRVDCGGDIWYVTYSRQEGESRILEGDWITGYGECDGVTSYRTVLGSQVTIPSMRMQYYS